ncbi:unnamed protein product, partial [marine sediment metagenome]
TTYPESIGGTVGKYSTTAIAAVTPGLSDFWHDCPIEGIRNDPGVGFMIMDNFIDIGLSAAITAIISNAGTGRYLVFGDAGATITPDTALAGGIVLTEATNDEAVSITTKQTPFQIINAGGNVWFEAKIKTNTITTAKQAWFCGLMDVTPQTSVVPLEADGDLADINLVGFHHPEANTTAFDTSYKADGVTAVEVNSNVGTLVAGTYVRLGMKFNTRLNQLSFYINGVQQAVLKNIPTTAGTDFPNDVTLAPVLAEVLAS